MRLKGTIAISAGVLALTACGHKQEANTTYADNTVASADMNGTAAAPMLTNGQAFANAAASSDAFEIASSKLALTSATSPAIKKFAREMISAHTDSTAKLKAAASSATPAIVPDPALTDDQQTKLAALKAATGKSFDGAYIVAQKDAHKMTLDVLRSYSTNGDVASLKVFATGLVPIVAAHLNMASGLK